MTFEAEYRNRYAWFCVVLPTLVSQAAGWRREGGDAVPGPVKARFMAGSYVQRPSHSVDNLILQNQPTLANPETGVVFVVVNDRRIDLAHAEYWFENNRYTVRSREFDCFETGETLDGALAHFGRAVIGYAATLQERFDNGEATESERETLELLSTRLSRIYLEEQREPRRRRGWLRRRSNRPDDREWGAVPA